MAYFFPVKAMIMIHIFKRFTAVLLMCSAFFMLSATEANAVRVSLKRIIFEGSVRSEILTIINNTGEAQTYRLGWRKYKMTERDSLRAVKEDEDASDILWADDMVRFAPRRVSIPAGSSQQIRLLLRRPADIQEAEYRSHLWIVTESKPDRFDIEQDATDKQSIRLAVQPAISLPIFVRHGDLEVSASIEDAKLSKTAEGLNVSFTLLRDGTSSLYGDLDFVCTDGGKDVVLKQVRGISVYTEVNKRYLDFDLPLGPEAAQHCQSVNVVYRADPDDPKFKGGTLAEASTSIN